MSLDYAALGFKAGLEIHQQLDTPKLFCRCPSRLDETDEADVVFERALRPTTSELGEVDPAALAEARKSLVFRYLGARGTCCLVEMDEEPPHAMSPEAVEVALQVAALLEARPVGEVHVMRKIVIDGSNTSGFQRTSLLATSGRVPSEVGDVRIATLCLEEDSARRLERAGHVQAYRLDRLGIPLVEIATEPDLRGPDHAREIAESIGLGLRATGRVKRGIGTIRQDLNVSIRDGARVEIKGVQELRLIAPAIEWEVRRQMHLIEVRDALRARGATADDYAHAPVDVTDAFAGTQAKMIASALAQGQRVLALRLPKLAGLLGRRTKEDVPPPRVGRELADYAKARAGVKGIFHSDELPAYGIAAEEVAALGARTGIAPGDAFALVVERDAPARAALEAVAERARLLLAGVPEETRDLDPDGTSRYLRPLPGGARMYPETDVPPLRVTDEDFARVRENLPELPPERIARLAREHPELGAEQARQLVRGGQADDFEALVARVGLVKEAARLLLATLPELEAEGLAVARITRARLEDVLAALAQNAFAKEAVPRLVRHMVEHGTSARQAAEALGLGLVDHDVVRAEIDRLLDAEQELVARQGMRAAGPLMGPLMAKLRGQVSGKDLSALLQERLQARLAADGTHP